MSVQVRIPMAMKAQLELQAAAEGLSLVDYLRQNMASLLQEGKIFTEERELTEDTRSRLQKATREALFQGSGPETHFPGPHFLPSIAPAAQNSEAKINPRVKGLYDSFKEDEQE